MAKISQALTYGLTIRESASDGSDFTNPDADYRRLFLGEDGMLHVKDSAGAVTSPYSGASEITDIATAETDDTLVLAPDGAGGVEWRAESGGIWTPDTPPASPHADDDEFTAYSGWTTLGALDTLNVTDYPGHLHMIKNTSGTQVDGIYKTSPSTPFTVTCKVSDRLKQAQFHWAGLFIGEAGGAGKLMTFGLYETAAAGQTNWDVSPWTNRTTRGTPAQAALPIIWPKYVRMIVTSSTNVTSQVSSEGMVWVTVDASRNPGFTVAIIGAWISGYAAIKMEATFDWIRFA
jgi:hypothetical protein